MSSPDVTCPSCGAVFSHPGGSLVFCPECESQALPRSVGARKFVLDTNVYDALCAGETDGAVSAACNSGTIELLMTHIQKDELDAMGDGEKLRRVFAIPFVIAPTYGVVLGTSKNGLSRFGEPEKVDAIRSPSGGHTNDALIATTAQYEGATLVTNERRLRNFATRQGIVVWDADEFCALVRTLGDHGDGCDEL